MSKRGENIRKRKDGRWEGRYKVGSYADGKTKYHSVYGKSYGEAKEKMQAAQNNAAICEAAKHSRKTFEDILYLWLYANRVRIKRSTLYKYEYLIQSHIVPNLGNIRISLLTVQLINDYLDKKLQSGRLDQSGGLSISYVKSIKIIIQSSISYAVEEGYCMPMKTCIKMPREDKKELNILSEEEQSRLETYITTQMDPTALGIMISLHTGLRIGEICALSWEDIDLKNRIIHVRHTVSRIKNDNPSGSKSCLVIDSPKTKSSKRDIPISSALIPILENMKKNALSSYLVSDSSDFTPPRTFEYRYHKVLEQCEIASINYHALRHTFATRCVEAGVDIKSLSEILGHSNVAITLNTYVHSSIELKRLQLEKMVVHSTR